jgi:hypothetical protein
MIFFEDNKIGRINLKLNIGNIIDGKNQEHRIIDIV